MMPWTASPGTASKEHCLRIHCLTPGVPALTSQILSAVRGRSRRFRIDRLGHGQTSSPAGAKATRGVAALETACYGDNVTSTNPMLEIDHASPVPLHEQVAAAIRRAIAEGEARAGERLPPARDLAAVLGVNANTVFRALRTLREEGLVEFRRGRGVSVTTIAPQRSPVVAKARELVALARRCGYRPQELVELIEQVSVELP